MATPLRKEHPEFDDEQEITTADLAQGKAPASETRGRKSCRVGVGMSSGHLLLWQILRAR